MTTIRKVDTILHRYVLPTRLIDFKPQRCISLNTSCCPQSVATTSSGIPPTNSHAMLENRRNYYHTTTCILDKKERPDPFARRPTAKCDPYGQGGKPLPLWEANTLLATLNPGWKIEEGETIDDLSADNTTDPPAPPPPQGLIREYVHPDFISGSRFVGKIAAVAQLNIHYPSIKLERRIIPNKKAWQVVSQVRCHTHVLGGLSSHDFHLAMLIDIEADRAEVKQLLAQDQES